MRGVVDCKASAVWTQNAEPKLREVDLRDVLECEVAENARRPFAAEELGFVAEAAVVEVDLRLLARLEFRVHRRHRTERAARREVPGGAGADDLAELRL